MTTVNIIIRGFGYFIMALYLLGIPMAVRMAYLTKGVPSTLGQMPWIIRFLIAWILFPFWILSGLFNNNSNN